MLKKMNIGGKKLLLLLLTITFSSFHSHTHAFDDSNSEPTPEVYLKDIGIMGLASHDLFAWDRVKEVNTENGRLDLSTIFDYEDGKKWESGGNPKNGENSPVYTITMNLVEFYRQALKNTDALQARKLTVLKFHQMIKGSFQRLSGQEFPQYGLNESVNNIEQAAMRALHDILPGRVNTYRNRLYPVKSFTLTNFLFAKFYLNEAELNQKIKYFDGDYDSEYKNIQIPFVFKKINLMEVDKVFIEKFSPYKQADMLNELALVGKGERQLSEVSFIHHIKELFEKGICPLDNQWMPQEVPCH